LIKSEVKKVKIVKKKKTKPLFLTVV